MTVYVGAGFVECDCCRGQLRARVTSVKVGRRLATGLGWRCEGGKDTCPRCQEKGETVSEFLIELWKNHQGKPVYVADPRTNDDDWRTSDARKARTWKAEKWARRWLRGRPELIDTSTVRALTEEERAARA